MLQVRLPRDDKTGNHKGIGFVDIDSQFNAEQALSLNGQILHGRSIEVYLSKPPAESSKDV